MPIEEQELLERIEHALADLRLPRMRERLHSWLAEPRQEKSRLAWLWELVEPQLACRRENRIERRFQESRLPDRKTLDGFDFRFQPTLDRDLVADLATLEFMQQGTNVLLAGTSGTGKSHLAKALGLLACLNNRRVRYSSSAAMLAHLNASLADDSLAVALQDYVRPELLIVDEIGLEQVERTVATRAGLFQKVLFPRYDQVRSTILTSNIPWDEWGAYLGDHLGATAILDRLVHRSHVIVINGPSYRDQEHKLQTAARRAAKADPKRKQASSR